jgi:hypothetical protein
MLRRAVGVFVGLTVLLVGVACGGSAIRLYQAGSSYDCLKHRKEFRPLSAFESPPSASLEVSLDPSHPYRLRRPLPSLRTFVAPGWEFTVLWSRGFQSGNVDVQIFDTIQGARAMSRTVFARAARRDLPDLRREFQLTRNAFIDWGDPRVSTGRVRTLVGGCLRIR